MKFIIVLSMLIPIIKVSDVKANEFEGKENEYYIECASTSLSINMKKTCKRFNKYLSDENDKLQSKIKNAKQEKNNLDKNIETLQKEIEEFDKKVENINNQIAYFELNILNYENEINKKMDELGERLYSMQGEYNSNKFVDFIFGAKNFADMLGRQAAVKEITQYENDIIQDIKNSQNVILVQKNTLDKAKKTLEDNQAQQRLLQQEYVSKLSEQEEIISESEEQIDRYNESMESINRNLGAVTNASNSSNISGIINAIPNEPIYGKDENGNIIDINNSEIGIDIANKALTRQGFMYLWGGGHTMSAIMNPNHTQFDCSGLVSWAHYQAGVNIGVQYTGSLVYMGRKVEKDKLQVGDIILFSDNGVISGVHHVGIYIGDNKMVHAPTTGSPIQVASLSSSYWQKEWLMARRLY